MLGMFMCMFGIFSCYYYVVYRCIMVGIEGTFQGDYAKDPETDGLYQYETYLYCALMSVFYMVYMILFGRWYTRNREDVEDFFANQSVGRWIRYFIACYKNRKNKKKNKAA